MTFMPYACREGVRMTVDKNMEGSGVTPEMQLQVEGNQGIAVIRGGGGERGWNGIRYKLGMSSKNTNAQHLSMNVARVPPGAVAFAHIHVDFEVMLYILQGHVRHAYGPGLKYVIDNQAGDFIFIEPGIPHEVYNISDSEEVIAVVARSRADEWDNIIPYDPKTDPNA
ncbi:MAG: cupin domain-containing protein [Chloroflexia bacterium]|nr:cupin domain-containing protein [Chloroflexia bacterium]